MIAEISLDGHIEHEIIEYPVPDWVNYVKSSDELEYVPDIEYTRIENRSLKLDMIRRKRCRSSRSPAIIYLHGGGWYTGSNKNYHNIVMALNGYTTFNIEYRLSEEAVFPAQIEDCKASVRWLRANANEYDIDPDLIGVWGHSAGGHLAALLGTSWHVKELEGDGGWKEHSSCVNAVVVCSAPCDPGMMEQSYMAKKLVGGDLEKHKKEIYLANPVNHISQDVPPFLILHGEADSAVAIKHSYLLHDELCKVNADVTFIPLKNTGHSYVIDLNGNFMKGNIEYILRFFDKHLFGKK